MAHSSSQAEPFSLPMIQRLLEFDTTSYNSNLELIEFAAAYLRDLGADVRFTHDASGMKANLFATLGPSHIPGIVLSGHTDVVPVDGQEWDRDPFRPWVDQGRLYGRGAADMKSFIGICLALAPDFAAAPLRLPIHFALSYDEEVGCVGVRGLIADVPNLPVVPRLCIVGEPTEMKVITGHKGKKSVRCQVYGHESHSALNHRGINAVEIAADVVSFLRGMQRRIRDNGPFDHDYDPPYTTVHTGVIQGGTALNIVPARCDFDFEFRNLPSHDVESLMEQVRGFAQSLAPEMEAINPQAGIMFDEFNTTAGLNADGNEEAADLARRLSGQDKEAKVSFTTEAGLFNQAGIPSVVCGPGSIAQAHRPNEYIELEQIRLGEDFIRRLIVHMADKDS